MQKIILSVIILVVSLFPINAFSQEDREPSMEELSKEIANPLAQVWNLSFQYNHVKIGGDLIDGSEYLNAVLFQPILPIPVGEKYTFFARPVITYIDAPTKGVISGGTPSHPTVAGTDRSWDFGDLILPVGFGEAKATGLTWGAGATFIFPTAQNDLLGSHKYQAGPAGVLVWASDNWLIGGLLQHWWDIADDGKSDDNPIIKAKHDAHMNHTDLQYFIIRHLPHAWQLRASPHIMVNWEKDSDNSWTVPVALGVGKMFKLGPMPVQIMGEVQYPLISPDDAGQELIFMLQANFVIKNPFGSL